MHLALGTVQDPGSVEAVLVSAVIAIAIFWRLIVRVLLVVIVATLLVALTYGAVTLVQAMHA